MYSLTTQSFRMQLSEFYLDHSLFSLRPKLSTGIWETLKNAEPDHGTRKYRTWNVDV